MSILLCILAVLLLDEVINVLLAILDTLLAFLTLASALFCLCQAVDEVSWDSEVTVTREVGNTWPSCPEVLSAILEKIFTKLDGMSDNRFNVDRPKLLIKLLCVLSSLVLILEVTVEGAE